MLWISNLVCSIAGRLKTVDLLEGEDVVPSQIVVAIEGIDGAGKSTLIHLLQEEFGAIAGIYSRTKKGRILDFLVSRKIMQSHHGLQIPIYLSLSFKNYIALRRYRNRPIILMDRCFLSNFCYFYFESLFSASEFKKKMRFEIRLMPQKIFIIDEDPSVAHNRDQGKKQIDWLITTREHYLQAKGSSLLESYHIEIITNDLTIEEKKERIADYIRREIDYGHR